MPTIRTLPFLALLLTFTTTAARAGNTPLTTVRVASGLTQPLFVTHAPGDMLRLFVVEKSGRIRIIRNGVLLTTPFLDISSIVNSTTLEWGLLGLAFHPDYQSNGFFFVNYCDASGNSVIARFQVTANPESADPNSRETVLFIAQPDANHRGGWLDFGPDGYLYDSQGDGGGQQDPSNRAQNINLLQGKILRLDVDGPDDIPGNADDDGFPGDNNKLYTVPPSNPFVGVAGADEIWAYGLRNPWRCSFDRETGDLWISDVGQYQREEVNYQPAASTGGENYGWRCMEASSCTGLSGCTCNAPSLVLPIHEYTHPTGFSITGGYVYRGCAMPEMHGTYFFADYQTSVLWSLRYNGVSVFNFQDRTTELDPDGSLAINFPASFGEGADGELYICDYGGEIFKIVPDVTDWDCDGNNVANRCEPNYYDVNRFLIPLLYDNAPAEFVCLFDRDGNGTVNGRDIPLFIDDVLAQ